MCHISVHMATLVDIYNGLLTYDGKDIALVIDDENEPWFYAKQITAILGYDGKGSRKTVRDHVDVINRVKYESISRFTRFRYNVQDHAIFVNQSGLYELVLRSNKPKAIEFKRWIVSDVIPSIKQYGKYEVDKKTRTKLDNVNKKLSEYKKKVKVLENNQKKPAYPTGGYVYIVHPPGTPPDLLKPGRTNDLSKRLNTYNTSLPDNMRVVHKVKVDDPVAVEYCVKGLINHLVYRKNKEFYKIKKKTLVDVLNKCAKQIKKARKQKRQNILPIDPIESDESVDSDGGTKYYAILAVPREPTQHGGTSWVDQYKANKDKYLGMPIPDTITAVPP